MNDATFRRLFYVLLIFVIAGLAVLTVLNPVIGVASLLLAALALTLIIFLVPGFGSKIRPRKKKKEDGDLGQKKSTRPNMHLESCDTAYGETIYIDSDNFTLGRAADNDYVFHNMPTISTHHAKITYSATTKHFYITDLGSKNGTKVDTARLNPNTPKLLRDGAIVAFDQLRFVFKPD